MTIYKTIIQIRDAIVSGDYELAARALNEYVKQEIEKQKSLNKQ